MLFSMFYNFISILLRVQFKWLYMYTICLTLCVCVYLFLMLIYCSLIFIAFLFGETFTFTMDMLLLLLADAVDIQAIWIHMPRATGLNVFLGIFRASQPSAWSLTLWVTQMHSMIARHMSCNHSVVRWSWMPWNLYHQMEKTERWLEEWYFCGHIRHLIIIKYRKTIILSENNH